MSSFRRKSSGTLGAALRNLVQSKPEIKIAIDNPQSEYTQGDKIAGKVAITVSHDTAFDTLDIEFVGTSRAAAERAFSSAAGAPYKSEAFHQFLRLTQPDLEVHFPENKLLKAYQTYEFPFVFVVPIELLTKICTHALRADSLRHDHIQVPPTMGDKDVPDDMVPDMCSIRYGVFARISEFKTKKGQQVRTGIASRARRVRIVPKTQEQPPLVIHTNEGLAPTSLDYVLPTNRDYYLRNERTLKPYFKHPRGTLVMEAVQPRAIHVGAGGKQQTKVEMILRYDPQDNECLTPGLGELSTKLRIETYYAGAARSRIPNRTSWLHDLHQGLATSNITLSTRCVENVEWTKYEGPQSPDSMFRLASGAQAPIPEPSESYTGKEFSVAAITVPVTLPGKRTFLPTFHTCTINRIYTLKLELGLEGVGSGNLDLRVPLQIVSNGPDIDGPRVVNRQQSVDSRLEIETEDGDLPGYTVRTVQSPSSNDARRSTIDNLARAGPATDPPPDYGTVVQRAPIVSCHWDRESGLLSMDYHERDRT